jgi:hypothetical protein
MPLFLPHLTQQLYDAAQKEANVHAPRLFCLCVNPETTSRACLRCNASRADARGAVHTRAATRRLIFNTEWQHRDHVVKLGPDSEH